MVSKRNYSIIIAAAVIFSFSIYFALAAHTITLSDNTVIRNIAEDTTHFFNITVNNTDAGQDANITQVNITLPSGLLFGSGTNGTDVAGIANFTNTTSVLTWSNLSHYLMNGTDVNYFWFNASAATPGAYNISVTTVNVTGAFTTNISVSVNDTTAPTNITFTTPTETDADNVSQTFIEVNVSAEDNGVIDTIIVRLFNSSQNQINTSTSSTSPLYINFSGLAEGLYYFNATINDTANNVNDTATRAVRLDTTFPLISYGTGSESDGENLSRASIYLNVSVTETYEDTITFTLHNSTAQYNVTTSTAGIRVINWSSLPDDIYTFNVSVNDSAGNINTTSIYTVTIDATVPSTVSYVTPTETDASNVSQTYIEINATATDAGTIDTIITRLFNSTHAQINSSTSSTSPLYINFSGLSEGLYYFNTTVNDTFNNVNTSTTYAVRLDTTPSTINYGTGSESNGANLSRTNIYVNVTVVETNEDTITFDLFYSNGTSLNSTSSTSAARTINWTGLSDNTYIFNVTVNDSAGNTNTSNSYTVILDSTVPRNITFLTPTETDASNVSQTNIEVNVSATDAGTLDTIIVRLHNSSHAQINTSKSASSPLYINFLGLAEGLYYFNATVNDTANNVNDTATRAVRLDAGAPAVSIVTPVSSNVSGSIVLNATVTDAIGSVDSVYFNVTNVTGVQQNFTIGVKAGNTYSLTLNTASLTDGEHNITVYANDSAGNLNSSELVSINVDNTLPTINYGTGSETNATTVTRSSIYVNVSVVETNEDTIFFRLHNSTAESNVTTSTSGLRVINWSSLPDDTYTFNVTVNDSAGNTNTSLTYTVTIDSSGPSSISLVTPTETDASNVSQTYIEINVTAVDSGTLETIIARLFNSSHGQINTSTSSTSPLYINFSGLAEGLYYFNATANDTAGGANDTSTYAVRLDATAPNVTTITTPVSGANVSGNITLNATAVDNVRVDSVYFNVTNSSGQQNYTVGTKAGNTYSLSLNTASLSDGDHNITVFASDSAGNVNSTKYVSVSVDNTVPLVAYGAASESDGTNTTRTNIFVNVTVTESYEDTIVFNLYYSNGTSLNSTSSTSAARTINWTGLSDNTYKYNVTVNDTRGNSNTTTTFTFIVDSTAPSVTAINSPTNNSNVTGVITLNATVNGSISGVSSVYFNITNSTGAQQSFLLATQTASTLYYTAILDTTTLVNGTFNITVFANDTASSLNNSEFAVINVVNPPVVSNFADPTPVEFANLSATEILYNVTVGNTTNALTAINITLFNSTGPVNSTIYTSSPQSGNFSNLTQGVYYINVTANDSAGENATVITRQFTLDTTAPIVATLSASTTTVSSFTISVSITETGSGIQSCTVTGGGGSATISGSGNSRTVSESGLSTATSYTYNVTCMDHIGYNGTKSQAFTTSSSGGSPGGGGTPTTADKTHTFTNIGTGSPGRVQNFASDIGLEEIEINVKETASDVKVEVDKYISKPSAVSSALPTQAYEYWEITATNLDDKLDHAKIKARVRNSWLSNNSLTINNISIFRFKGSAWEELETSYSGDDGTNTFFIASTDSFSYFAVGEALSDEAVADGTSDVKACADGIDNDEDGLIDLDDPGCENAEDDDEVETETQPQCADGIDNDGDELIDLDDPGCKNTEDDNEKDPRDWSSLKIMLYIFLAIIIVGGGIAAVIYFTMMKKEKTKLKSIGKGSIYVKDDKDKIKSEVKKSEKSAQSMFATRKPSFIKSIQVEATDEGPEQEGETLSRKERKEKKKLEKQLKKDAKKLAKRKY